ncbi:OmpA family outer membrane lipoprotein Loa22 [Leptospira idonii]|uniref:OmpA family protein n=1 Tax=Leptospira idonii TaxID=1193500 RepID=A0A4R9LZG9_9LEPT|nr:OmpA family protein [Leptospira idonii]TGN19824.1 OmpA family protein [Leptospira idonii]
MKKGIFTLILIAGISLAYSNCSSAEPKQEAQPENTSTASNSTNTVSSRDMNLVLLDEINTALKDYRYPDGVRRRGFSYKQADVLKEDFGTWAKDNIAYIKEALGKLPEDYLLQIIGHADASGPEEAEGGKKGNGYYSQIRADAVKDALVKQGIPASRISTKAAGSSAPISGFAENDGINRRVTFQVISK